MRFRTSASFCCLWWRVEMKSHFNNMKGFSDSTSEDRDWAKVTDHPKKYLLVSACIVGVLIFSLMYCVGFMTCFPFWDLQFYKHLDLSHNTVLLLDLCCYLSLLVELFQANEKSVFTSKRRFYVKFIHILYYYKV